MTNEPINVAKTIEELDDAMEGLGFYQAESVDEALSASNQVVPVDDLTVDELGMFADEKQTVADAVGSRDNGFIPVPRKRNGIWFQLKNNNARTEMLMCHKDEKGNIERLPTGVGWDKRNG